MPMTVCFSICVYVCACSDEELRRLLGHSEFVGALIHMAGGTDDSQQVRAFPHSIGPPS
eukprot:SAG11_NODE_558_length_8540_cov_3.877147_6_plen_59_part_00